MFLDESGDLGPKGSKYFLIAALAVKNPEPLDRIIKNMRRNKFKKELKKTNEIKANSSSNAVQEHMIKELNNLPNAEVHCICFRKNPYYPFKRYRNTNQLYDCIAGVLAEQITLKEDTIIRIDRSKGNQFLRKEFDQYFLRNLNNDCNGRKVKIHHSNSNAWSGIQFADILAGAYFQKFEHEDSHCVDLINLNCNVFDLRRLRKK